MSNSSSKRIRQISVVTATKDEIEAIKRGRAEIEAGEFITLDELLRDMKCRPRKSESCEK